MSSVVADIIDDALAQIAFADDADTAAGRIAIQRMRATKLAVDHTHQPPTIFEFPEESPVHYGWLWQRMMESHYPEAGWRCGADRYGLIQTLHPIFRSLDPDRRMALIEEYFEVCAAANESYRKVAEAQGKPFAARVPNAATFLSWMKRNHQAEYQRCQALQPKWWRVSSMKSLTKMTGSASPTQSLPAKAPR